MSRRSRSMENKNNNDQQQNQNQQQQQPRPENDANNNDNNFQQQQQNRVHELSSGAAWKKSSHSKHIPPQHYQTLGLDSVTVSDKQIQQAYKKLAIIYHPDRLSGKPQHEIEEAKKKFQQVQKAYAILGNVEKRADYDGSQGINLHLRVGALMRGVQEQQKNKTTRPPQQQQENQQNNTEKVNEDEDEKVNEEEFEEYVPHSHTTGNSGDGGIDFTRTDSTLSDEKNDQKNNEEEEKEEKEKSKKNHLVEVDDEWAEFL